MKCRMTKELERLIAKADKKLEEAQGARYEVMAYIEDHYDIDRNKYYEQMENQLTWCYGIDASAVQDLIEAKYNGELEE